MTSPPHRALIIALAGVCRTGRPPSGFGDDVHAAIVEAARTSSLHDGELYRAAHDIVDACPASFPLIGARQAH